MVSPPALWVGGDRERTVECEVKKRELEKRLRRLDWVFLRHGGKQDVWTDGEREEAVPRHAEINENLARSILRRAERMKEH